MTVSFLQLYNERIYDLLMKTERNQEFHFERQEKYQFLDASVQNQQDKSAKEIVFSEYDWNWIIEENMKYGFENSKQQDWRKYFVDQII